MKQRIRNSFGIMLYGALLLLAACGDDRRTANTLSVAGLAAFAQALEKPVPLSTRIERVPAQQMDFHLSLTLVGRQGGGCAGEAAAKQTSAKRTVAVVKDERSDDPTYLASYQNEDITSVSKPACRISEFALEDIEFLRITASLAASPQNCDRYCAVMDGDPTCSQNCQLQDRRILATKRLSRQELASAAIFTDDRLIVNANLAFNRLGPILSSDDQPDLALNAATTANSVEFSEETFEADSCALAEGCIGGPGTRRLMRFDTEILNLGGANLEGGDPEGNPEFEFSACHEHHHSGNLTRYELLSGNGMGPIAVGRKQGFCLMDTMRSSGNVEGGYTCEFQGITSGWSDLYDRALDCQWIDITGVPPGTYHLRLTVNPDGRYSELDLTNNVAEVQVTIPPLEGSAP